MSGTLLPFPWLDLVLILALVAINGLLSMSELAIVSAREARLKSLAKGGSKGAKVALALAAEPGRFLSTVQIGITLIGILASAYSGSRLGEPVAEEEERPGRAVAHRVPDQAHSGRVVGPGPESQGAAGWIGRGVGGEHHGRLKAPGAELGREERDEREVPQRPEFARAARLDLLARDAREGVRPAAEHRLKSRAVKGRGRVEGWDARAHALQRREAGPRPEAGIEARTRVVEVVKPMEERAGCHLG